MYDSVLNWTVTVFTLLFLVYQTVGGSSCCWILILGAYSLTLTFSWPKVKQNTGCWVCWEQETLLAGDSLKLKCKNNHWEGRDCTERTWTVAAKRKVVHIFHCTFLKLCILILKKYETVEGRVLFSLSIRFMSEF